jgi:CRISPR-associated protein Cas1
MSTGCAFSSDAVKLAVENNVDIVFVEHSGRPIGRVWHSRLGSTSKIRKAQLEASLNLTGLHYIKSWLGQKLNQEAEFVSSLGKHRPGITGALSAKVDGIREMNQKIQTLENKIVAERAETIRGHEGTAGRYFFEAINECLPREWQFKGRSSRPAKDTFNAFLNYAFGILYSRVEKALIIAGVDPYVGFMHRDDYNQLSFVFDFIEPYRIWAVETVFRLFSGKKVNKSHTDEITNGVSLNKEGKELLVPAFIKFIDETKLRYKGRNLVRSHILQLEAHTFANELIRKTPVELPKIIPF